MQTSDLALKVKRLLSVNVLKQAYTIIYQTDMCNNFRYCSNSNFSLSSFSGFSIYWVLALKMITVLVIDFVNYYQQF